MPQSWNNLAAVPYVIHRSAYTISDDILGAVFQEVVDAGHISTVFHDMPMNSVDEFIKLMRNPINAPVFIFDSEACVGFAWLNGITKTSAYGHFCYLKHATVTAMDFGQKVMQYWDALLPKQNIEVVIGVVPSFNARAGAFVQKLGFKKVGEIPRMIRNAQTGESWAAMLFYRLTR